MPSISVVIPALNEQSRLKRALESTRDPRVERIVVDGGSTDGTPESARFLRAERVLHSLPGRARQMEEGAREARADVIVFLHADTRLGPGWQEAVLDALADPQVAGGAFRLRFESDRPGFRVIEWAVRIRCRFFGLPYGDQALFVRRKLLAAIGGVPDTPIFEDLDLARAIRAHGRLALLPVQAFTSARRYEANGALRIWLRNTGALIGYLLDFDRARVARWYARKPRE